MCKDLAAVIIWIITRYMVHQKLNETKKEIVKPGALGERDGNRTQQTVAALCSVSFIYSRHLFGVVVPTVRLTNRFINL